MFRRDKLVAWPTLTISRSERSADAGLVRMDLLFAIQSRLKELAGPTAQLFSPQVIHLPSATPSCVGPGSALGLDWWTRY